MTLSPGQKLGAFDVIERLGAGGMGEVYKARDTRLGRTVAIKILPAKLSQEPDLKARFEREAQAISRLNHPHICTLYDIGSADGVDFIIMEHIEGETLAERLRKGALPLHQTLEYAIQMADALDKAHQLGIVHRDLKPGNVMITKAGVKLLDFGLAKLQDPVGIGKDLDADSPTQQRDLTTQGTVLGTLGYMAPEQLEGRHVDGRADIFAFGAVVYEMVTGEQAFPGRSQASVISAIMSSEPPPLRELGPGLPLTLERIVHTCLAKEPLERWQSIADVRRQLSWLVDAPQAIDAGVARARPRWAWPLAGAALLVVGFATAWSLKPSEFSALPTTRFVMTLPDEQELGFARAGSLALSPDGRVLVYTAAVNGEMQLFRRDWRSLEAEPIEDTEGARGPFFSPDGEWIGFFTSTQLKKVPTDGGITQTIGDYSDPVAGTATWGPDDTIVFGGLTTGLRRVPATGGTVETLTTPDPELEQAHVSPHFLPDGRRLIYTSILGGRSRLTLHSLETGESRLLDLSTGASPKYLSTGHLVYGTPQGLFAVPFDAESGTLSGPSVPVIEDVSWDYGHGKVDFAVSENGTLVYIPQWDYRLVWVDRDGGQSPILDRAGAYLAPRLSPDGSRLAVTVFEFDASRRHVWVYDLERQTFTRFTRDTERDMDATDGLWSPDGRRIAFARQQLGGIARTFVRSLDSTREPIPLTDDVNTVPSSWSGAAGRLFVVLAQATTRRDVGAVSPDGESHVEILLGEPFDELHPILSPDGKWLAYASDETGSLEVYVRSYPELDRRWPISSGGGREPRWSGDGSEIFYRSGDQMMAVRVETSGDELTASRPEVLFEGRFAFDLIGGDAVSYDVTPDGHRFVMVREEEVPRQIHVVLGWLEELKPLVAGN